APESRHQCRGPFRVQRAQRPARRHEARVRAAHRGRSRLLCREPGRLDPGAVARRGLDRLSDAFDRVRPERGRGLVSVRRIAHGAETDRHRLHRRGRVSRRALLVNFLPFARPTIDEAMIAAVADTLRSRWIVTGPRVAAFEKALSERFGGRPVRALTSATAAMQVALELLDIVSFSFHPNKSMTTIEGGALALNDEREAAIVDELRFHGIKRLPDGTRDVERAGVKYNFSDVSARLGLEQLARLEDWCRARAR